MLRELEHSPRVVSLAELEELRIRAELAAEPVVSPIPLPPEFDWIAENSYRDFFHERMQREPIDSAWASTTESQLTSFLYRRPAIVSKYGPPTVLCHTTQCEVTFVAHGIAYDDPSVASTAARSLFDASFEEMRGRFDCDPGECWVDANSENGVVTIFWAMTKKESDPQGHVTAATARD